MCSESVQTEERWLQDQAMHILRQQLSQHQQIFSARKERSDNWKGEEGWQQGYDVVNAMEFWFIVAVRVALPKARLENLPSLGGPMFNTDPNSSRESFLLSCQEGAEIPIKYTHVYMK